jgi:hypothetical protein
LYAAIWLNTLGTSTRLITGRAGLLIQINQQKSL